MFLKIPKMIFAKKCNDPPNKNHMTEAPTQKISSKSSNLVNHVIDLTKKEIKIILEKSQDLKKTNYELALKHFEKGNISEAAFRLWLMTKFWPDYHQAHYKRAYFLFIDKKPNKAKKILNDLLQKNSPMKKEVQDLLNDIYESENNSQN